jgi:HK97 gp10 family phage protein
MTDDNKGFLNLIDTLNNFSKMADEDNIKEAQEAGAAFLVGKLRRLSKPRNTGKMLESMDFEYNKKEKTVEVGWGKFYGRLVESGHKTRSGKKVVSAKAHLKPTFEANKNFINKIMIDTLKRKVK